MELVKNIFFNTDKIVENSKLKVSYVGDLYQAGAEEVYMHYGFNPEWDNVSDIKMEKTELGFQCEIDIDESNTLNFCFNDGNGNWDNNDTKNYVFEIEKVEKQEELALTLTGDTGMELHKGLRKTYIWSKKVKLAIYKILHYMPKIISGNFRRKVNEE